MPRRRPARNEASKRPAPALPEGDEGKDMDREKRREKVQTLIRDFKTEGLHNTFELFFIMYRLRSGLGFFLFTFYQRILTDHMALQSCMSH